MRIDVFTLFPEAFEWFAGQRHVRNAVERGSELRLFNYRDTTPLSGRQVDDTPYGGGAGMVLRVDVVDLALRAAYGERAAARAGDRARRRRAASSTTRSRESWRPSRTWRCSAGATRGSTSGCASTSPTTRSRSGPYVLSGGELAAMVVADAVLRKLPGALGHADSAIEESFSEALGGAPEYPHYTRPASYRGWDVPEVLLSGDHARVREWRLERSRARRRARLADVSRGEFSTI